MRTLYIALIFVGCLSLALGADPVTPAPYPQREQPIACASAADTPKGCSKCILKAGTTNEFQCETAAEGYYIDAGAAKACPQSCATCDSATACKTCRDPKAWKANAQTPCQECDSGYTLDIVGPNTDLKGVCISVSGEKYTCATGLQWNSLPNPNRACVANNTACLTSYSSTQDGTGANAVGNGCGFCAKDTPTNVTTQNKNSNQELYWSQLCVKVPATTKREVVQCTGATATTSCKTCTAANKCSEAEEGYYIVPTSRRMRNLAEGDVVPGLVAACPSQCKSCKGPTECLVCNTGFTKDDTQKTCNCNTGTPSIDQSLITTGANVSYTCITQISGQSCESGNVWNTPVAPIAMDSKCVQILGSSPCYKDTRTTEITAQPEQSLSSVWDQAKNPNRKCILATSKQCAPGYAATENQESNISNTTLPSDCTFCIKNYVQSTEPLNQVCTQATSSSILVMSLAFLGLLLALVF